MIDNNWEWLPIGDTVGTQRATDIDQEEMQFLGFYGCYKQSSEIIFTRRKIFTQITMTLILPLLLSKFAYFTLLYIFSLLSTPAVVYTAGSIYTANYVTFQKVMSVVPKLWKRVMLTFLCACAAFFAYNIVAVLAITSWAFTIRGKNGGGVAVLVIIAVLYFIGFVYLTLVWQLASVVTVLEDSCGVQAMKKSKDLIKGKMVLSVLIFVKLIVSFVQIRLLFKVVVANGWSFGYVDRTLYGILCFLMLSGLLLFGLVLQTVLYFVCKSYHHENIHKSALAYFI